MKITPASHRTGAWRRIAALAGEPTAPPGSTPAPDCCEPGEVPPDRAAEDTSNAVMLSTGGTPALVQAGSFGNTSTLTDPTIPGHTLVAIGWDRSGGDGGPPTPSGYTLRGRAEAGSGLSIRSVIIATKVADGSETNVTGGSIDTFYHLSEWTGSYASIVETQDNVASTTALDTGGATTPATGVPSVLIGAGVMATPDSGSPSVAPDSGVTELVDDFTGGFSPLKWAGYRSVPNPTTSYTVSGVISSAFEFGGVTIVLDEASPTWSQPAPRAVDDDDTTYETITGTDLLRIDLGAAFRIVRTRIRIAGTTSGARVITIKGANLADFSDEVTLDTIAFTATGGLTAQDVTGLWSTDTSYQFFELSIGTSDTYRIHSWELYEQTPGTIIVTNPADSDAIAELQEALDDIYDAIALAIGTPTNRWEAVTDGEDVFVWSGDDLVHEFKEYL